MKPYLQQRADQIAAQDLHGAALHAACTDAPDPAGLFAATLLRMAEREGMSADAAQAAIRRELPAVLARSARVERGRILSGAAPHEYLYGSFSRPLEEVPDLRGLGQCVPCPRPADDQSAWGYLRTTRPLSPSEASGAGLILLSTPQTAHLAGLIEETLGHPRDLTSGEQWLLSHAGNVHAG